MEMPGTVKVMSRLMPMSPPTPLDHGSMPVGALRDDERAHQAEHGARRADGQLFGESSSTPNEPASSDTK